MLKFYESTTFAALRYLRFVVYANVGNEVILTRKQRSSTFHCIFMLSTLHLKPGLETWFRTAFKHKKIRSEYQKRYVESIKTWQCKWDGPHKFWSTQFEFCRRQNNNFNLFTTGSSVDIKSPAGKNLSSGVVSQSQTIVPESMFTRFICPKQTYV